MSNTVATTRRSMEDYKQNPALLNEPSFESALLTPMSTRMSARSAAPAKTSSSVAPAPRLGNIKREKFNSTATIFMNTMIRAPDVNAVIKCLAIALHQALTAAATHLEKPVFIDVFDEVAHPLGDIPNPDYEVTPLITDIHKFIAFVFHKQTLSAECAVMAFAYIDRLVTVTSLTLHATNWRRILLGALILASKVWEDLAVWNVDFLATLPSLSVVDLNRLERTYLTALQFNVSLKASVYARYYFELRALKPDEEFPMDPLSEEAGTRLEARSRGIEVKERRFNLHNRGESEASYTPSSKLMSIEDFRKVRADQH